MSGDTNLSGYLGLMLGAVVGALREDGSTAPEIHRMVDIALRSRDLAESVKSELAQPEPAAM